MMVECGTGICRCVERMESPSLGDVSQENEVSEGAYSEGNDDHASESQEEPGAGISVVHHEEIHDGY